MFIGKINHRRKQCTASKAIKEMQTFKNGRSPYMCIKFRQINKNDKMQCGDEYTKECAYPALEGALSSGSSFWNPSWRHLMGSYQNPLTRGAS